MPFINSSLSSILSGKAIKPPKEIRMYLLQSFYRANFKPCYLLAPKKPVSTFTTLFIDAVHYGFLSLDNNDKTAPGHFIATSPGEAGDSPIASHWLRHGRISLVGINT